MDIYPNIAFLCLKYLIDYTTPLYSKKMCIAIEIILSSCGPEALSMRNVPLDCCY